VKSCGTIIASYVSALVAFSGGIDSSLALTVAARALPEERVLAVTRNVALSGLWGASWGPQTDPRSPAWQGGVAS
jgi:PP-loop superfamily ATP-utilizing enzyme